MIDRIDEPWYKPKKTYTLVWRNPYRLTKGNICRCRFDYSAYFCFRSDWTLLENYLFLLLCLEHDFVGKDFNTFQFRVHRFLHSFRLFKAGKLVARMATYQGV